MRTTEKLLIVNADDLGRTAGINRGVFEAHERGIVTSATLMVGYPHSAAAAERAAGLPHLGLGLHVALTGAVPPVASAQSLPTLLDSEGRLPRTTAGLTGADPGELRREVRAQFDRFRALTGKLPTHLDGHHHCHRLPGVREAVIELATGHGLPVRNASPGLAVALAGARIATNDVFEGRFYGDEVGAELLVSLIAEVEPGVTEMMCHPAYVDDELQAMSTYAGERVTELAALTDPRVVEALDSHGVRLIHFGELPPS